MTFDVRTYRYRTLKVRTYYVRSLPTHIFLYTCMVNDHLEELRRRVDALFQCASGRVNPTYGDVALFVSRLASTANALLRERFPEECGVQSPLPKRQRHESIVCSGSWVRKWDLIEDLERECGPNIYEEVEVRLQKTDEILVIRQFTSNFWCSGCRLWDSAVALGRFLLEKPELVRDRKVIEVGCGVAPIPGLCAARVASLVWLTEGEPNLISSITHNLERARSGSVGPLAPVQVGCLNWSSGKGDLAAFGKHDVLLGSDLLYSSGASEPLAAAASELVREGGSLYLVFPSGRHGIERFSNALKERGWKVNEEPVKADLLQGCSNQGSEEEVSAHTFVLLHAIHLADCASTTVVVESQ